MTGRLVAIALIVAVYGIPMAWGALELRNLRREQQDTTEGGTS